MIAWNTDTNSGSILNSGAQKGNLKREEFFDSLDAMNKRYRELFKPKEYALNPTAWEKVNGEWLRMFITSAA